MNQYESALKDLDRAIELRGDAPKDSYGFDYYYGLLAEAYLQADRLAEFEQLFEASTDFEGEPEKKAVIYNQIATIYGNAGQNQQALSYYKKAIALDNKTPKEYMEA